MSRNLPVLSLSAMLMGGTALADAPRVAVDIAPVHALVARVMDGVGTPDLIVRPGASPHGYSLRPSEAKAMQDADLVFWIGEDLAPWMEESLETLATRASITTLLETEGTALLDFREGALFEAHDDHDEEDHAKDEEHGDHDEDEHSEDEHDNHGHEDHAENDHADDDGHDHGAHDPHAWLSPRNASFWLDVIASQLSAADPENADIYAANAAAAQEEMKTLIAEVNATLEPIRGRSFVVFHDAYQYFETDFGIAASGAISLSDASDPSPARIAEIQARIRDNKVDCVLAEPQFNPGIVATVLDGTEAHTGVIDPLGAKLTPGADLYPQLIRAMANTLADCMAKTG